VSGDFDDFFGLREAREMLTQILANTEKIMSQNAGTDAAVTSLQDADTSLQASVTQVIADWQAQIAGSAATNDPAIAAVAADMQSVIGRLQAADPATATGTGTGTSNTSPVTGPVTGPGVTGTGVTGTGTGTTGTGTGTTGTTAGGGGSTAGSTSTTVSGDSATPQAGI
jgi:hypothetical protein